MPPTLIRQRRHHHCQSSDRDGANLSARLSIESLLHLLHTRFFQRWFYTDIRATNLAVVGTLVRHISALGAIFSHDCSYALGASAEEPVEY